MAGNRFEIQVVALDKATAVFRKINNSMTDAMRPVTRAQRQWTMLSREMHLEKITKGMSELSHAGMKVASSLGLATEPMEALFGLGAAGGIVAAAGAVVGLATRWGKLGFEVGRTADQIGVSTDVLQRYRGAARLAGLSEEALTESFANLGKTLQDAASGRNAPAYAVLNKLGIGIMRTKDGVVDVKGTFDALSDSLARNANPQVRQLVASIFGVGAALPLLNQGPEAIARLAAEAQKLGLVLGPKQIKEAEEYAAAMHELDGAATGMANNLGALVVPGITRGINSINQAMSAGGFWGAMWDVLSGNATRRAAFGGSSSSRSASGLVTDAPGAGGALPAGLRLNNPGNLRAWGSNDRVGGFARFNSSQDGLDAMAQQIGLYANRDGLKSIAGIVSKWAPPSDHNDTGAYIADVSRQTGFDPNAKIDVNDPKVLAPLISAMVRHEQGQQPFSNDQLTAAASTVNVHVAVANAPPGTRVSTSGDAPVTSRVTYAMPMGDTP